MKPGRAAGVRALTGSAERGTDFRIIPSATGSLWKVFSIGVTGPGFLFKSACVVINDIVMLCVFQL